MRRHARRSRLSRDIVNRHKEAKRKEKQPNSEQYKLNLLKRAEELLHGDGFRF